MFNKQTLTVVSLSDMFKALGLTEHARHAVLDYGFNTVTFGDASYTLIPGWAAIDRIVDGLMAYYDELEKEESIPTQNIPVPIWDEKKIRIRLGWEMEDTDYVDLES